jgi:outer membrane lipoprotein-sorting protein
MRSCTLISLIAAFASPAHAETTLADVQAHLKAITSMTAHFSQTDRNGKTLSGALQLKRPGKIRFEYQKDAGILIVANGKTLNFIDYRVRQVSAWPIGNSPLGVLLDPNRDLSKIAHLLPGQNDSGLTLVEARDAKHPEFGTITMGFAHDAAAPAGLSLHGWVSMDSQGNRTVIRLTDQRFNAPISDEAFLWRDPRPTTHGH